MKPYYTFLLALLTSAGAFAQIEIEKTYRPSYSNTNDPRDMIAATGGGYYITGMAEDVNGDDAMFVMKVDDNLDSLWTKYYHNANFISQRGDMLLYNSSGNLCVIGITNGPGVHHSLWELDLNGDTIRTRTFATGNNGIDFLIPDALPTSDGGYIVLVQKGTTSGSVHSFDADWNLRWKNYGGSISNGWPDVDVNAQFVGVEMIDTVLYYAARKASGADNKSYFVKSGESGAFLGVQQYGVNAQGIRAEDLVITDNNEALLVGMMTTQISPGLSSERTMILRTNLDGDSLAIKNDLETSFPKNATLIDGKVVVDCVSLTPSSGSRMGIGVYNQDGSVVGKQELEVLTNDWDLSQGKVCRTVDAGNGKRVTMGVLHAANGSSVIMYKYQENLVIGLDELSDAVNEYNVYPNPASAQFAISGLSGKETVHIYNTAGETVYTARSRGSLIQIGVEEFSRGVYMVQVNNKESGQSRMLKLVVN